MPEMNLEAEQGGGENTLHKQLLKKIKNKCLSEFTMRGGTESVHGDVDRYAEMEFVDCFNN